MAVLSANDELTKQLDRLSGNRKPSQESKACFCGESHLPADHGEFLASMPQDPVDLLDDLVKMRLYKPEAIAIADTLTSAELQKALFLQMVSQGSENRQQLCNELIKQAGGWEEVWAAAFGHRSAELFSDTIRNSQFTRRQFLRNIAIGAALVTLANCSSQETPTETAPSSQTGGIEKTDLQVGFIPITCATPLIMAEPLRFYKKHGLNVKVVKMRNWAAVRDSAIAGELDAYHMLAPMPIAITLGLGSTSFPIKLASIENINGQAITVAVKHKGKVKTPSDFKGFRIGVPFQYSMHNLLLRYYLAAGGLNPNKDVRIDFVPPPDSVARLTVGDLDAMLMPDPFNQRAVFEKAGFLHILSKDIWPGHPCCAFAAGEQWISAHPNTFQALNKAIIDSTDYARDPDNRQEIAEAISDTAFLNQPEEVVAAVLSGKFEDGLGNTQNVPDRINFDPYPWQSFARWISSQLVRWDFLPQEKANYKEIGEQIFMTDLARDLATELGTKPPTEVLRVEKLKFDTFDPADPAAYVKQQIQKFSV